MILAIYIKPAGNPVFSRVTKSHVEKNRPKEHWTRGVVKFQHWPQIRSIQEIGCKTKYYKKIMLHEERIMEFSLRQIVEIFALLSHVKKKNQNL